MPSALGLLRKAPEHTTLYRFLRRLDERALGAALNETVRCLPKPEHHEQEPAATVAVDATGLAPGAISTFYVRRTHNRGGEPMLWRRWLKWLVVVDTDRQMVLAQEEACSSGPYNGSAMLCEHLWMPPTRLLRLAWYWRMRSSTASTTTAPRARTARCSERDPGQAGHKATWQVQGHRAKMRAAFAGQLYRRRALVESVFSAVKRKLSARAPGRSLEMQRMQALLVGLAYNLYRLRPCPV